VTKKAARNVAKQCPSGLEPLAPFAGVLRAAIVTTLLPSQAFLTEYDCGPGSSAFAAARSGQPLSGISLTQAGPDRGKARPVL
jgi:hypothetical protein